MKNVSNVLSYLALGIILCTVQLYTLANCPAITPLVFVSQILLLGVVLLHLGMNLFHTQPSFPDASVVVFEIIFLIIAPAIQFAHNAKTLVNTQRLDDTFAVQSNMIYVVFIASYLGGRFLIPPPHSRGASRLLSTLKIRYVALIPTLVVCAIAALSAFQFAQRLQAGDFDGLDITPLELIRRKLFFFLIFPVFVLIVSYRPRRIGPIWLALAISAFIFLFLCQNPAIEKRNTLGPIYLTLLALLFRPWLRSSPRVFWSIFVLSGLFFPVSEIFTHHRVDEWPMPPAAYENIFAEHFTSTAYDAWANTEAVVEMVSRDGIAYGKQLAGSLLFFVPHTAWPDKPLATGIVIGEFLSRNYTMWFFNLSAPLPAEGYLDFSWGGVILYGTLLGYFSRRIDALIESAPLSRALGLYLSFYLTFLLRGSLMIAVAYIVPVFLSFQFVSFALTSHGRKFREAKRAPGRRSTIG
ncbi:hypothetical protein PQR02_02525 [Paraburkholderia sediminicola]|uniref:Uncharacterized protein n=1 Tax=Paraburkholderia rhynchosiae TaxID=487049 RepID=A0ACC7N4D5_9BURK